MLNDLDWMHISQQNDGTKIQTNGKDKQKKERPYFPVLNPQIITIISCSRPKSELDAAQNIVILAHAYMHRLYD